MKDKKVGNSWDLFSKTGRINDYLRYKGYGDLFRQSTEAGEELHADFDRGADHQGAERRRGG